MKEAKAKLRSTLLFLLAGTLFAVYWFWVNQKIISGDNHVFGVGSYFILMSAATAFFPLPSNLIALGAAKIYTPLVVGVVGGMATIVAYGLEYIFFTYLFRIKRIADFRNSWLYKKAAPLFDRHRFFILSFVSFLPIPSEALRIYAITNQYSKILYPLAGFVGRTPRYYLLVFFGKDYASSLWFILSVLIFPAVFLLVVKGVDSFVEKLKRKKPQTASDGV
ncbi:hypothetical protein MJD09_19035 [bacterium]|nr:hypothetical protein [bacterium]